VRVRGESGRVAARVRNLLNDYGEDDADEPTPFEAPGTKPWQRVAARMPVQFAGVRPGALAIGVAALLGIVLLGLWLRAGRAGPADALGAALPTAGPAVPPASGAGPAVAGSTALTVTSATASPSGSATSASVVVVDVAGRVRHPGVYRLPSGSRVEDALRAAGGARPGVNLDSLNLAAVLTDGEQIPVGVRAATAVQPAGASGATGAATGPVDLNTATLEQLETLPGVGPVLGQRILDWRTEHGAFGSVEQLDDVPGIGSTRLAELSPLVTV
jgi:competence protein ComEA